MCPRRYNSKASCAHKRWFTEHILILADVANVTLDLPVQIVHCVNVHQKPIHWEGLEEVKVVSAQGVVRVTTAVEVVPVSVGTTGSVARAKRYCFKYICANKTDETYNVEK